MYGRVFTSQSDIYMLPSDNKEHTRLDLQHYALRCNLNSLYPYQHLVQYALRKDQDPPPEILDVGELRCQRYLVSGGLKLMMMFQGQDQVDGQRLSYSAHFHFGSSVALYAFFDRRAVEMATEFPHAAVTGMDLTPPTQLNHAEIPPNCRYATIADLWVLIYGQSFSVPDLS